MNSWIALCDAKLACFAFVCGALYATRQSHRILDVLFRMLAFNAKLGTAQYIIPSSCRAVEKNVNLHNIDNI